MRLRLACAPLNLLSDPVFPDLGCYINTKGIPTREAGFLKWETKITSYACRAPYVFLVSSRFIEIRNIGNGRLLQVVEGGDIRMIYGGTGGSSSPNNKQANGNNPEDNVLVAMRGRFNDKNGLSEKIVELVPTEEIGAGGQWGPTSAGEGPSNGQGQGMNGGPAIPQQVWAEWDM
jgi:RHO1 GDP-GTP exchange protein 1/2